MSEDDTGWSDSCDSNPRHEESYVNEKELEGIFNLKDFGDLKYYLGISFK